MYEKLLSRLEYAFRDETLLETALRHPSCGMPHNQRLEFLGDAVLQLCVSDDLYRDFTSSREGEMTAIRQRLVCENALAEIARGIGLGAFIRMEKGLKDSGGAENDAVLSDAMEAVLAAVYLDGGFAEAKRVVDALWDVKHSARNPTDAKSALQMYTQSHMNTLPAYRLDAEEGPVHDRRFCMSAVLDGRVLATAWGKTKKQAEQNAACRALEILAREEKS